MADRKNNLRMSGAAAFASGQRGPSSSSGTRMKPNTTSIDTKKVREVTIINVYRNYQGCRMRMWMPTLWIDRDWDQELSWYRIKLWWSLVASERRGLQVRFKDLYPWEINRYIRICLQMYPTMAYKMRIPIQICQTTHLEQLCCKIKY